MGVFLTRTKNLLLSLKSLKSLPGIGLIIKPELFFLYFNFLVAFKGKGLHMNRIEVFGTLNLILLQICLNICLIKVQRANISM